MAFPVQLERLTRQYRGAPRAAVDSLDLDVAAGEVVCLVGPSGCGKSTTLRMIAGLDQPNAGRVRIGDTDVTHLPPQDRDVAMVFQGFALYPHLTVREILAFPLKMRRVPAAERKQRVERAAEMLAISALLDRKPAQLSGGEQQRVAMGRAIVREPRAFLFDEPLSNLDAALRAELRVEIAKLLKRLGVTALYVTHDQAEAMTLSDRIAVLRAGRLEQLASPRAIYERPASTFVAGFFGTPPMNLARVDLEAGQARLGSARFPAPRRSALTLGVRPEHTAVVWGDRSPPRHGWIETEATITAREPHGAETHLELDIGGQVMKSRLPGFDAPALGEPVVFAMHPERLHWFDSESGLAVSA